MTSVTVGDSEAAVWRDSLLISDLRNYSRFFLSNPRLCQLLTQSGHVSRRSLYKRWRRNDVSERNYGEAMMTPPVLHRA